MREYFLLLAACLSAQAQDRYIPWGKNLDVCPRVELAGPIRPGGAYASGTTGGQMGASPGGELTWRFGAIAYPSGHRKDASLFSAIEQSGTEISMQTQKGKVVIVGFWSVACEASLFLLGEMAQLQPKGDKFGFAVFPVNFDPERWQVIGKFLKQSRMQSQLKDTRIYTSGLGSHGVNCFMDVIPALPTYFILDRNGAVAVSGTGYVDGNLVRKLKQVLQEPAESPIVTSPATTAPPKD